MDSQKVGYEILVTANLVRRIMDKEAYAITKGDKLSGSNMQILGFLKHNIHKEIHQKDIEKEFSLRASTVSANLRLLEKKGYITREYSTEDTRLKKVILTQKSIDMHEKMHAKAIELEEQFSNVLSEEERETLFDLLSRMQTSLK